MTDVTVKVVKTVVEAPVPREATVIKVQVPGPVGPKGDDGVTLVGEGAHIYRGTGVPSALLGADDEWYIDAATANMYQKQAGVWTLVLNIAGPEGPAGPAGADGAVLIGDGANILTGSGVPDNGIGTDGDLYINTDNSDVYSKEAGAWSLQLNIRGSQGAQGIQGIPGNPGTNGTDGWSPLLAVVADGARSVLQVADWSGGTGTKPDTGDYIGATGLVSDIASAINIRGAIGPEGPAGADGADGAPGADGADGADGQTGSIWYTGTGAPSDLIGTDLDLYLNLSNGDVYEKASGTWGAPIINVMGPAGTDGADGADGQTGSVWRSGVGVPSDAVGTDLDFYLNTANGDVYQRSAGHYSVITNIKGADGTNGADGADGTNGTDGEDGRDGNQWFTGTGVPSDGIGEDGDLYLNIANGDVYQKASGTWGASVANITGPAGADGADGAPGADGADGAGLPTGGNADDVLKKQSGTDFDYEWVSDDRTIDTKTDNHTFALADRNKLVEMDAASDKVFTAPPNATVALPIGYQVDIVRIGAGGVSVAAGAGVTVNSPDGNLKLRVRFSSATIYKRGTDEWVLVGDLSA